MRLVVTLFIACFLLSTRYSAGADVNETQCTESYRTVYTECSEVGRERWKVTVTDNADCKPPAPTKVANCDQTCPGGQVLYNFETCQECGAGNFSLGDRKVLNVLDPNIYPEISFVTSKINRNEKSCPDIRTLENSVELPASYCWNVVNIPFEVVAPGSVTLHYLHSDDRISVDFYLKDFQSCDGGEAKVTISGDAAVTWQNVQLQVAAKGKYIFQIKSTAFFNTESPTSTTVPLEPPRLGNLTITGVEPYTKCQQCPPGHVTGRVGSSECTPCLANQYAELSGSLACKPCVGETYSLFGAGKCEEKVECGGEDFRPVVGECVAGKSTVSSEEIYQNKCRNSPPSQNYDCPACQPGREKKGDTCVFCPEGTHNPSGSDTCTPCEPNTISLKGLYQVWWDKIPDSWNVRCQECWVPAGVFLLGRPSQHQPVIAINFGEIEFSSKVIKNNVVGMFSVKFKLYCPEFCTFLIIKKVTLTSGNVERQEVAEKFVKSTGEGDPEVSRAYVHKSDGQDGNIKMDFSLKLSGVGSYIQLHNVNFTNTLEGGSSFCFPCSGSGCMECAQGMVYKEGKCVECPAGWYHVTSGSILDSSYTSQCLQCPSGTISQPGSTSCYTPCTFTTTDGNQYDISPAGDTLVLNDRVSYPDQFGNTYHYRYLLMLCSQDGNVPVVTCSEDNADKVSGVICRESVMRSSGGEEVISNPVIEGEMLSDISEQTNGVTLHFTTVHPAPGCDSVTTNVTLLCNRDQTSAISLVDSSDNCRLAFEYSGPFGCRLCKEDDFKSITSSCEDSIRNITYVKEEGVMCSGGASLPPVTTEECTPYQDSLVNSIKRYKFYVGLGVSMLVLLIAGFCFLAWYSSSLKHKLDGYSRMNYADDDDNYEGAGSSNKMIWADSGEDSEGEENLYTRYEGKSPGNIISDKLDKINQSLGIKKYQRFGDTDIMEMSDRLGI